MDKPDPQALALLQRVLVNLEVAAGFASDPAAIAREHCQQAIGWAIEDAREALAKLQAPPAD